MPMNSYETAAKMDFALSEKIKQVLGKERPEDSYATVSTIDRVAMRVGVRFPGETEIAWVKMGGAIQPVEAGQTVRVAGLEGHRRIIDVLGPGANNHVALAPSDNATAPLNPRLGEDWFDPAVNRKKYWDGTVWREYGGLHLISRQVVTGSAATTVSFSSIPSTYKNLKLDIRASQTAAGSAGMRMRYNGVSTGYYYQWVYAVDTGPAEFHTDNDTSFNFCDFPAASENSPGGCEITIFDYSNSADKFSAIAVGGTWVPGITSMQSSSAYCVNNGTAVVISSLEVWFPGTTVAVDSAFSLYGMV